MADPLGLSELSDPARVAATVALISIAAADGVVDDDELTYLVGDLGLEDLDPLSVQRVAEALLEPESVDGLALLSEAPILVRAGLVLRMVEVAGTDGAIAPGELEQLVAAGSALGITEDQIGAIGAFLGDVVYATSRGPADAGWFRLLVRAGGTLLAAGVPAGALGWCGLLRRIDVPLAPLDRGLGLPVGSLQGWLANPPGRTSEQLNILARALNEVAPSHASPTAVELRARSIERLARSLEG